MDALKVIKDSFAADASMLGDYALMTKTELANGYCDEDEAIQALSMVEPRDDAAIHQHEMLRSAYYAALMLRYWHKIYEWSFNSASLHLEITDFVDWLSDSLYVAFYYRTWRYQHQAIVQHGKFIDWSRDENGELIENKYWYMIDPNAPDKIINRCCGSMRGRVYQYHNKEKRKVGVLSESLDQLIEDIGDSAITDNGCYDEGPTLDSIGYLVSALIKRGNDIEALIVDGIAYHDAFKEKKNTIEKSIPTEFGDVVVEKDVAKVAVFDARKLVKHLSHINPQFMRRFCDTYAVTQERGTEIYNKLQTLSNPKLYNYIKKTLIQIRDNPTLLSCIQ